MDDAVEEDVVLPHELPQLHCPGRLGHPPLKVPLGQQSSSHGDVADGGLEPHVEHLLLVAGVRHWHAPLQVPSDAAVFSWGVQPTACGSPGVVAPSLHAAPVQQPLLQCCALGC